MAINKETPSNYLLGMIMANQIAIELHLKATLEIARTLGEEFPQFETVKEQISKLLLQEAEKMRRSCLERDENSDAFLEGLNFGVDRFKKFVQDVS